MPAGASQVFLLTPQQEESRLLVALALKEVTQLTRSSGWKVGSQLIDLFQERQDRWLRMGSGGSFKLHECLEKLVFNGRHGPGFSAFPRLAKAPPKADSSDEIITPPSPSAPSACSAASSPALLPVRVAAI